MDLEQSVDSPDSSPAQNAAERGGTSADPEPRVCNICGLCKFRFHEGQAAITGMFPTFFVLASIC